MNATKTILAILLVTFVLMGGLGLSHFGMDTQMDGSMDSNCFMPGMTEALCQMNPLEHVASWQSMFTAIPSQSDVVLLLLALLALALGALFIRSYHSAAPPQILVLQPALAYYKRRIPMAHSLQEAFSNGILHPKLF